MVRPPNYFITPNSMMGVCVLYLQMNATELSVWEGVYVEHGVRATGISTVTSHPKTQKSGRYGAAKVPRFCRFSVMQLATDPLWLTHFQKVISSSDFFFKVPVGPSGT